MRIKIYKDKGDIGYLTFVIFSEVIGLTIQIVSSAQTMDYFNRLIWTILLLAKDRPKNYFNAL
jgi:hypothetical protein